jgi:hypothetical protein
MRFYSLLVCGKAIQSDYFWTDYSKAAPFFQNTEGLS